MAVDVLDGIEWIHIGRIEQVAKTLALALARVFRVHFKLAGKFTQSWTP